MNSTNSVTVEISEDIARALIKKRVNYNCSKRYLPNSFKRTRSAVLAVANGPVENLAKTLTATRGRRATGTMIPKNMVENFAASEEAAWSHSDLAGVLFEHGFRCVTAIKLASA